jgi:hypothetical protein
VNLLERVQRKTVWSRRRRFIDKFLDEREGRYDNVEKTRDTSKGE